MKQITINIPDNCELKQDCNTYTIVEKEEKLTYEDVAKKLFNGKTIYWIGSLDLIEYSDIVGDEYLPIANNALSRKQLEKLLAINKLMNVAKYLNDGWQPDWNNMDEVKLLICCSTKSGKLYIDDTYSSQLCAVYFKSIELAQQAIEILGEETIKLALCTDY